MSSSRSGESSPGGQAVQPTTICPSRISSVGCKGSSACWRLCACVLYSVEKYERSSYTVHNDGHCAVLHEQKLRIPVRTEDFRAAAGALVPRDRRPSTGVFGMRRHPASHDEPAISGGGGTVSCALRCHSPGEQRPWGAGREAPAPELRRWRVCPRERRKGRHRDRGGGHGMHSSG